MIIDVAHIREEGIKNFFSYINERHSIYLRRQNGVSYKLTTEEGGVTIIPEDNTNFLEVPDTLSNIYSEANELFTLEHRNVPIEVEQHD